MFRFGWEKLDAKLIDQRFLRRDDYNTKTPGTYQVWEYIVEFNHADGKVVRLPVEEKTFKVNLPDVGGTVPILVNKKRTKAAFNLKDPRIDAIGALDRKQKARKERDEARFEARMKGEDPPAGTESEL